MKLLLSILVFIVIHILIVIGGTTSSSPVQGIPVSGVLSHFGAFFAVAASGTWLGMHMNLKHAQEFSFIYAVLLGLFIEMIQKLYPYRYTSVEDIIVNMLGAGTFFLLVRVSQAVRRRYASYIS